MKHLLSGIVFFGLSFSAFAGSPFLPISSTNTFKSGERAQVEAAVAQAEAEGKLVIVDMAAAWCGPCYNLEQQMKQKEVDTAFQDTLSHFVYVKLEEMHIEMMGSADFLPHEIPWFPSLYLYNPTSKKWTFLYTTDADALKTYLDIYLVNQNLGQVYWAQLNALIDSGNYVGIDNVLEAALPLVTEESGDQLMQLIGGVLAKQAANPSQFTWTPAEFEEGVSGVYQRAIEMGKLTLAEIRNVDPNGLAGIENDPFAYHSLFFMGTLGHLIRSEGNKAASDQCAALAAASDQVAVAAGSSPEDQHILAVLHEAHCLTLKLQLKEATAADADTFVAGLQEGEALRFSRTLMRVYAQTGTSFDKAAQYGATWKAAYEKKFEGHPEAKPLLERVKVATASLIEAFNAGKSHP